MIGNPRELALATLIALVVAASPLTGEAWGPALVVGSLVGGGVFAYRRRYGAAERASDAFPVAGFTWPTAIVLLGWAGLFAPTIYWLVESWTGSVWSNNHGIFMPFIATYVGYDRLRRDRSNVAESSAMGLPIIGVGALVALADQLLQTGYLATVGLIATLPGMCLALLGSRRTHLLIPALVLTLLTIPIPNGIATELYLRHMTAASVEWLLHAVGYPALRADTVLQTPRNLFVVSNACSGVATLYASVAVASVLATLIPFSWRLSALFASAVPLALAANVMRVLGLVLMTEWWGMWVIESPLHPASGVAAFGIVVAAQASLSRLGKASRAAARRHE